MNPQSVGLPESEGESKRANKALLGQALPSPEDRISRIQFHIRVRRHY
jgi:hypothetical protein